MEAMEANNGSEDERMQGFRRSEDLLTITEVREHRVPAILGAVGFGWLDVLDHGSLQPYGICLDVFGPEE